MNGKIKKFDLIRNMAVFQDFEWNLSVRDKGNNIVEFEQVNILYGRNYSGKTTLSRIFRALETGSISDKYDSPSFQLSFDNNKTITQTSLNEHNQLTRVFNEDFIRDNLHFIHDSEKAIKSFAILGEENAKLEEQIKTCEGELGSEEKKSGLCGELINANDIFTKAERGHRTKSLDLDIKLRGKANRLSTGIKHNRLFADANYNVPKLKKDIATVTQDSYSPLTDEQISDLHSLLKEDQKNKISDPKVFNLQYSTIAITAKDLIERKVQTTAPMQELLNDAVLAKWVRTGQEHHQGKKDKCTFCGGDLPPELWEKLDMHFNKESENLQASLDLAFASIEGEQERTLNILAIKNSDFYSKFNKQLDILKENLSIQLQAYHESLNSIKNQLKTRKNNIFTPLSFNKPESTENSLNAIRDTYEELRIKSNEFTESLSTKQSEARNDLRLQEVHTFINNIGYNDELSAIDSLNATMTEKQWVRNTSQDKVTAKQEEIARLKGQLKDESKGADRVNDYLSNFCGHQFLSLKAIEEAPGNSSSGYRFEVTRNNKKAFHLSEGESSLIAFCYFMAKLEDINTKGNQPIIWIDDPISSLDSNHIFFVYSLIKAEIVESKKFLQLFISTHNLNFLKYLKSISKHYRGSDGKRTKVCQFFLLERSGETSQISLMPNYMKNYITEFNYLFHQIYKCANAQSVSDENYHDFLSFGNNARKFLEIYLYYRYPDGIDNKDKLLRFFGEESTPTILTKRLINEYSHLCGEFERGASPIEAPEMQAVAQQIISKLKEDHDQYKALLQSIGIKDDPIENSTNTTQDAQ